MEIWKKIKSAPNYEASNFGRIRRSTPSRGASVGRVMTPQSLPAGYLIVNLIIGGHVCGRLIHRLVAEVFIGDIPFGFEINHKDSIKSNNRPENLEIVTRSQNICHARDSKGTYRGERNSRAIISINTVLAIRKKHSEGMGYKLLAKHFGLSWGLVRGVATRRTWRHVAIRIASSIAVL